MNIPFLRQLTLVLGVSFNIIGQSTMTGYSAILLPQLRESSVYVNKELESLIVSGVPLGMLVGVLIAPMLMDRIGRKRTHLLTHIPMLIGWVIVIFTNDARVMIAARMFQGIGQGLRLPIAPIIVGECTSPKYRGIFISSTSLSIALGVFYVHLIGTFFNWKITGAASLIFNVISIIIIVLLPESPTWLAKVGRNDEAYLAFQWYRGDDDESKLEFNKMSRNQQDEIEIANHDKSILEKIKSEHFLKPFLIVILLSIGYIYSGNYVISSYTVDILSGSIPKSVSPYLIMLLLDSLRIIVAVLGCVVVKKFNRRTVLHLSASLTVLSLLGTSFCLFLDSYYNIKLSFILISSLLVFIFGLGIGLQNLPYVLKGEIFIVSLKALSSSLCSTFMSISAFVLLFTAPYSFSAIGKSGTFLLYAMFVLSSWVILCYIMPETKDKSLVEIEEQMKKTNRVKCNTKEVDRMIDPEVKNDKV